MSEPRKTATSKPTKIKTRNKKKSKLNTDDTPKSFARLMAFHTLGKRLPSGLDDGSAEKKGKKRKLNDNMKTTANATTTEPPTPALPPPPPKIQPGERLSDFAARVDQALPISGLRGTDKQRALKVPGLKEKTTKHNKRLERMQKEWREEEARRKARREEEVEELEDEREERGETGLWADNKRGKKRKNALDGEDPWKALEKTRAEAKQKNLQDVVQAPPQLKKVKSKFKDVGGGVGVDVGNVPGSVGSLRKREEMGEARREVIEGYRRMMGRKGDIT